MKNQLLSLYKGFFEVGLFTFGGGYAMLPMLEAEIVEKRHYATEEEMLDYYAVSQCTPGVIAVNCATFIGYKVGGVAGAAAATLGVITPSIAIILLIASILTGFMDNPYVAHALSGIRIVVCALVLNAIYSLGKKGIKSIAGWIIFACVLIIALFTPVPTIVIILLAAGCGVMLKCVLFRDHYAEGNVDDYPEDHSKDHRDDYPDHRAEEYVEEYPEDHPKDHQDDCSENQSEEGENER